MSDPDMKDFFRSPNRAKKYNDALKKKKKLQQGHMDPITPFSPATMPQTVIWRDPVPPIDVVKRNGYPEWEWMGITFRPYYAGNLWLNCDASHVYKAFLNRDTYEITSVEPLDIKIDADGKQYVENWVNKVLTKVYLDDALRAVYHTGLAPVHIAPIAAHPTQINQPMKNPQIFNYQGVDYSFYHDGKFCVSRNGGLACWMHIDWSVSPATYDKPIPYNVKVGSDGRKFVSVKQSDGTWKDFDMAVAVAKTYLKDPTSPNMEVKFKDGNVGNCDADNLYWDMP